MLGDGYRTRPARVWRERGGRTNRWLRLVLREGHKRQIRESARAVGLRVERLIRVRLGPFHLGTMGPGEWRLASPGELEQISPSRRAPAGRRRDPRLQRARGRPVASARVKESA
jgi:23S rRNA pseudouridine2605 synthase